MARREAVRPPSATGRQPSQAAAATRPSRVPPGRRGRLRRLLSWRALGVLVLLGIAALVALFAVGYAATDIPAPNEQAQAETTVVYFADGATELGRFSEQNRTPVTADLIPEHMQQAIIAAEDRSFADNRGISPTGIVRAFYNNLRGNSTQGGSTITQQYVKNFYLDSDQTYARKVEEAFLAIKIDQRQSKTEIMTNYLNTIYFGRGAYGVQAAAQAYFRVNSQDLTREQAAMLAGIVPAPSAWDPAVDPQRAQERYDYVLDGEVELGFLDRATREAMAFPAVEPPSVSETYAGPNGYVLAAAREELLAESELTEAQLDTGGLRITTTIDPRLQQLAIDTMNDPDVFPVEDRPATLHSALTTIDSATGAVRAMYGGADYLARPQNSATQDVAQAGSTYKPFALVAALREGVSLRTRYSGSNGVLVDGYTDEDGDPRGVQNFGGSSYGRIDLVQATENSVNTVYVALNEEVGPAATTQAAIDAGLPPDTAGLNDFISNVLGTASPHPIDMAHAYSTFANRGLRTTPHFVAQVTRAGSPDVLYTGAREPERVFDEAVMDDTNYALQQVVESGSGEYASRLGRPAAGKTGTSTDNQSAWFVGYTPTAQGGSGLTTSVALFNVEPDGTPSPIPRFGGRREITGGSFPVQIWTAFMDGALEGVEPVDFAPRADVGASTSSRSATPSPRSSSPSATTTTPTDTPTPTATDTAPATPTQSPTQPTAPPTDTPDGEARPPGGAAPGGRGPSAPGSGRASPGPPVDPGGGDVDDVDPGGG